MANRARVNGTRSAFPRTGTFGTAAVTARQRLNWIWSRESLLRLVLSFVLALALWLYISNKQNPAAPRDFGQPLGISYLNVPEGMTLVNSNLGVVYVRIKRVDQNTPVTSESFHAFVNLLGLSVGEHRVRVQVLADPGIDVVQRSPSTVMVELEKRQSRNVPVQANPISHVPTGYGLQLITKPTTVTVSGPAQLVRQVAHATYDVDLSGLRTTVSGSYRVRPENSQGALVTGHLALSPSQVHVKVAIQALSSYKALPVLPRITGQPKAGYTVVAVVAQPAEITATGSPSRLNRISSAVTGSLSVTHRGAGTFSTHVPIRLPKGVSSHVRSVKVTVQLAPVESSSSIETAVGPTGVTPGLSVDIRPAKVLATVVGPSTDLRGVGGKLRAVVNLTGYVAGTYTLTPTITPTEPLPSSVHVEGFYPSTVTVRVFPSSSG